MEKKKVLFVASIDRHINAFHIPYLKYFKDNGYEVHVAANGEEEIQYCDKRHIIHFERSPFNKNNIIAYKEIKDIINSERFDIIHTHTPMASVLTRLAARDSRKHGTKVIYTAHGFHFYKGAPLQNWIIYYPIEKILSRYTDCLITINKEDYNLANRKFKAKRIELVYGVGVDESKFKIDMTDEQKKELRNSIGINEDDFVMIIVGELNKNKNQILAINAMKELIKEYDNIKLLLVGIGDLQNYYENIIKENGLQDNIKLLGYRQDIPKLLKISNILLSLSYREGLPVNVIEALISGLPVIVTGCRGNVDLIENEINGFVIDKNNKEELLSVILNVYLNNIQLIISNTELYNTQKIIKEYEKIYIGALDEKD